jgi:hypothetical protein
MMDDNMKPKKAGSGLKASKKASVVVEPNDSNTNSDNIIIIQRKGRPKNTIKSMKLKVVKGGTKLHISSHILFTSISNNSMEVGFLMFSCYTCSNFVIYANTSIRFQTK